MRQYDHWPGIMTAELFSLMEIYVYGSVYDYERVNYPALNAEINPTAKDLVTKYGRMVEMRDKMADMEDDLPSINRQAHLRSIHTELAKIQEFVNFCERRPFVTYRKELQALKDKKSYFEHYEKLTKKFREETTTSVSATCNSLQYQISLKVAHKIKDGPRSTFHKIAAPVLKEMLDYLVQEDDIMAIGYSSKYNLRLVNKRFNKAICIQIKRFAYKYQSEISQYPKKQV